MILASSDAALSLRHWELAEYISEGFVILGCAGELIADLATRIPRRTRRHIERWSTILLVMALTVGLKCLVRTNELSGSVIGSLGEEAEEADAKAKIAVTDSSTALFRAKDALTRAGKAESSLGKAEDEATKAQTSASGALSLAQSARKEADTFEGDIAFAKKQAADIAKQLAPRTLNPSDWETIGDQLRPYAPRFSGRKVGISSYSQDPEGIVFSLEIAKIFERAGIEIDPAIGRVVPVGLVDMGVNICGPIKDGAVVQLLAKEIHDRADTDVHAIWNDGCKGLQIDVDSKPIAGLLHFVVKPK